MWLQETSAEELAELFHHYHQALADDFGCKDNSTLESWNELPQKEKSRAVAAARLTLMEIASTTRAQEDAGRYFAKPGEAEWGC
jgi:hypothetical protein